ncbi:hypothetical protein HAX54_008938 [Datura stramonium]|uniref:Uncharacterized protein n=1 Tax=Datura stramonium TaxID=4076 RepID=A0ABS8RZ87_DATST|nr:hypothetical protein [Datura stramonium]
MENNNQSSFWQFSDQLRLQNNNLANLSLNDSIWSSNYGSKRPEDRRNFDIRVGGDFNSSASSNKSNYNLFSNDGWKIADHLLSAVNGVAVGGSAGKGAFGVGLNGGFNKGVYSNQALNFSYSKGTNNIAVRIFAKGMGTLVDIFLFATKNDTMAENLQKGSLACHHVTGTQLQAGGSNIDPSAWEDKKNLVNLQLSCSGSCRDKESL